MQILDAVGIRAVESHARQGVADGVEIGGGVGEVETVGGRGRSGNAESNIARQRLGSTQHALLVLHLESAAGLGSDAECVAAGGAIGDGELQADSEMRGMAAGAAAHFLNAAALAQGMVERRAQGIGDETRGVQEIAFAGAVGAYQQREGM